MPPFTSVPPLLSQYMLRELYKALPPSSDDTPETLEARDLTAMTAIAHLGPVCTAEAYVAVQAVACQFHASACLREANENRDDFKKAMQCRAQSSLMMRQAALALKELRTLQNDRAARLAWRRANALAAEYEAVRRASAAPPAEAREMPAESHGEPAEAQGEPSVTRVDPPAQGEAEAPVPALTSLIKDWVTDRNPESLHRMRHYSPKQIVETLAGFTDHRTKDRPLAAA